MDRSFRLAATAQDNGLSCDATGLFLAGVPLLGKGESGFSPRSEGEIAILMNAAYGDVTVEHRIKTKLGLIADALNEADIGRAMVAALHLQLPELDREGVRSLALAGERLAKYDPDEPRDWRGRWTTGGSSTDTPTSTEQDERSLANDDDDDGDASLIDVGYEGYFHDKVVKDSAALLRAAGANVIINVRLVTLDNASAIVDLLIIPPSGEPLILLEIKTGKDPKYKNSQLYVYPMSEIGEHVSSPDSKILQLGFFPAHRCLQCYWKLITKKMKIRQ